jgi:NADH-quinone oxidoreductase subunit J
MADFLFLFLAIFTVGSALAMVCLRNSVHAAMCLLLCLAGVAGMMVQLDAFLLAFLLILIYAGAVMALFLFIIMLLDLRVGAPIARRNVGAISGFFAGALLIAGVASLIVHDRVALPAQDLPAPVGASLKGYANALFTTYMLPIQVIGFLLLISMLGVIVLSQRAPSSE